MKRFLVLMCALFLSQATLAGKGGVIPGGTSASTITVVVDGGGAAGGSGAAGDGSGGGSNISPATTPSLANVAAAISSGAPISITGSPAQLAALQTRSVVPTSALMSRQLYRAHSTLRQANAGVLGRLAQLGKHRPYKPGVAGSNPAAPTTVGTKVLTESIYATNVRASLER